MSAYVSRAGMRGKKMKLLRNTGLPTMRSRPGDAITEIDNMEIREGIFTGRDYYWKRTDGWDWFGTRRWWEVSIEFTGLNGSGGAWVKEKWRWNNNPQVVKEEILTLSIEKTEEIVIEIKMNIDKDFS